MNAFTRRLVADDDDAAQKLARQTHSAAASAPRKLKPQHSCHVSREAHLDIAVRRAERASGRCRAVKV
jgi:hypothetical protein